MEYIIVYNAESDFILCSDEEQVKREIAEWIKTEGIATDDITLYEAKFKRFEAEVGDIKVTLP